MKQISYDMSLKTNALIASYIKFLLVLVVVSNSVLAQQGIGRQIIQQEYNNISIAFTDSLNGWRFIGSGIFDSLYTVYSDTATEGGKSQLYGWSTSQRYSVARWEKYLSRSYVYPESIKIDVRCITMQPSINQTIETDFGFLNGDSLPCESGWGTPNYNWRTYTFYNHQCTPGIVAINRLWLTFQFHPNLGDTSTHGGKGEYLVDNLRFYYPGNLVVLVDGFGDPSTNVTQQHKTPSDYSLAQNYPNPFNPTTTINYQIQSKSYVTLKVFDLIGREVARLVSSTEEPGYKSIQWNTNNVTSGVYFYQLKVGEFVETRKMTLIR